MIGFAKSDLTLRLMAAESRKAEIRRLGHPVIGRGNGGDFNGYLGGIYARAIYEGPSPLPHGLRLRVFLRLALWVVTGAAAMLYQSSAKPYSSSSGPNSSSRSSMSLNS